MGEDTILTLYVAHRRRLTRYASRIVGDHGRAEDIVQEAFLRFRKAAAGRLLAEPVGFLYRVVHNLSQDQNRSAMLERRYVQDGVEDAGGLPQERPSPEQEAIARQELQKVMAAMEQLPERTRIALEMHRFGGCTLKEIAARLGISVSMAQVLVMDGVRHCQRSLKASP